MSRQWVAGIAGAVALCALPSIAGAQACGEIVLGAALSETGKYSANGKNTKDGYEFVIKKIKDAGGVKIAGKCYNFRVIYYDDESTPARAAQLVERLVNQDKVQYMLGPYSSGLTKAILPVTEKYQIPVVQAEGASRSLFTQGYKYQFAVLSTSEQYLGVAVDLAAEMAKAAGKKPADVKVAMIFESDPFSLDVRAGVLDDIKRNGLKTVIDDKMPRDLNDMTAFLTKVKALKPDVLFISGHEKGAATGTRQIGEMGINVPLIGVTHCESAKITSAFSKAAEGILCPTQWSETLTYADKMFGSAAGYNKAFLDAHKDYKVVPYQTAQASAAILVFKDAFERAGSLDKEKLREALQKTDMMTFYGPVKFGPSGNNPAKPMVLRQVQGGKYVVVAPTKYASSKLVYPRKAGN
ncbi:MAG: amino acid ABC transporter substrate-binding protein [Hyphomicrobiaceae bacterium]